MKNKISKFLKKNWEKHKIETLLFLGVLVVLPFFMIHPPANGDTYTYARSLSSFDATVVHFGYYVIGAIMHFFMRMGGASSLLTLGYLSVLASAICVVCMYMLTLNFTNNRLQSLIAAFILLFSGTFMLFSLHGEVYIPQLAVIMLAAILILKGHFLAAGLFEVVACSITPTSLLALFPLGCLVVQKKAGKIGLFKFLLPFLILAVLFLCKPERVVEVFAAAVFVPELFVKTVNFFEISGYVFFELAKVYGVSFNIISLFALGGVVVLLKENRKVLIFFGAWFLPFLLYIFNLGLLSGDHLIITFIPVSFFASEGIIKLFKKKNQGKALVAVVLFFYLVVSLNMLVSEEKRNAVEIQRVVAELHEIYEPRAIMFSKYNFGVCYWYSVNDKENIFILSGRPNMLIRDTRYPNKQTINRLEESFWLNWSSNVRDFFNLVDSAEELFKGRTVYFSESLYWPSPLAKKLWGAERIQKKQLLNRTLSQANSLAKKLMGDGAEFEKIIDSPLCPVYRIKN
ncbi:MAG: glycosyltransferase family 39 protein [PVC group bacterium]|nr:glycosyltransferase family 39 protein [PVC group bacterium]